MRRYFFHVDYGEHTADLEGTLLPGPDAARVAAVSLLGELLRDQAPDFWNSPDITISVVDADGQELCSLGATGRPAASAETRSG